MSHRNFDEIHGIALIFDDCFYIFEGVSLAKCYEIHWKSMRFHDSPLKLQAIQWLSLSFNDFAYISQGIPLVKCNEIHWSVEIPMTFIECHGIATILLTFYKGYPLQNGMEFMENQRNSTNSHLNIDVMYWIWLKCNEFLYILQGIPLVKRHEIHWQFNGIHSCPLNFLTYYKGAPLVKCNANRRKQ